MPQAGDGEWEMSCGNASGLRIAMQRTLERGTKRLRSYGDTELDALAQSGSDRHGTLSTVTRSIMHEFNNHHAVILSSLERLTLQGSLNEKQRDTIDRGIQAIDRATEWIRRLRRNLPPHSVQLAQFNPRNFSLNSTKTKTHTLLQFLKKLLTRQISLAIPAISPRC